MNTNPRCHTLDRARPGRVQRAALLFGVALLIATVPISAEEETPAVLKMRELDFFYRSSVAVFSCPDLENRVASILRALGARQDVQVQATGCSSIVVPEEQPPDMDTRQGTSGDWQVSGGPVGDRYGTRYTNRSSRPQQSAHVRARAMMPVEVTPEILAEMEKDKSRRELISRVTGNPGASMNDPIVFPASRQLVELSRKTADLDPEECELIEQMSSSAFRKLGIKVVRGRPNCDRDEISHIPLKVTVEALMPIFPTGAQLPPEEPESGATEPPAEEAPAPEPAPEEQ